MIVKAGTKLPTPFLDISGPVRSSDYERGLLSMAFAPDYPSSGRFYVYYTSDAVAGQRGLGDLIIAEYRRSANPDVAETAERVVLQITHPEDNHNGGQLQFGPDGYLYIGTGDGGSANDPPSQRAEPERPARKAPADRSAAWLGRGALHDPDDKPLRRAGRYAAGDLVLRPAQSLALLVRSSDGRPHDRRRWAERLGGDRLRSCARRRGRGANFGWKCFEGRHESSNDPPHCSPPPGATTRRPCTSTDTPAASRSRAVTSCATRPCRPSPAGTSTATRFPRPLWSAVLQTPTAADDRQLGLNVGDLYSFGEDACGRVYAASGGGSVQRLKASGSPSAPTCTPSALPPPPPPPGPPAPPPTTAKRKICRVPKLKGLRGVTARARIRRANCRVGRVRSKHAARRRGRVISQAPRAGARRIRGTRVHFTVSRGRR